MPRKKKRKNLLDSERLKHFVQTTKTRLSLTQNTRSQVSFDCSSFLMENAKIPQFPSLVVFYYIRFPGIRFHGTRFFNLNFFFFRGIQNPHTQGYVFQEPTTHCNTINVFSFSTPTYSTKISSKYKYKPTNAILIIIGPCIVYTSFKTSSRPAPQGKTEKYISCLNT